MEITSTEAQNNFGQYMKFAEFEDIIVTRNGKRAIVIKAYREPKETYSIVAEKAEAYGFKGSRISYEEFLKLSESSEERYEYIDGEVYLLASPVFDHQTAITEILNILYNRLKAKKCRPITSPFDITLVKNISKSDDKSDDKSDGKNVVQPDVLVICDTENINEKGRYTGIPTLVIEVLSRTTRSKDMLKKLDLYMQSGVQEYWIVNTVDKEIYLYYFEKYDIMEYRTYRENETLRSEVFKGLEFNLIDIFI